MGMPCARWHRGKCVTTCMDTATSSSPLLETTKVVGGLLGGPPALKVSIAANSGDFLDSLCVVKTISPELQWLDDFTRGGW